MSDVERITTTERYSELANAIWREAQPWVGHAHADRIASAAADVVLLIIERERVRVVEGLVATIKSLPLVPVHWHPDDPTDLPSYFGDDWSKREGQMLIWLADVLAVVEAAREDTA